MQERDGFVHHSSSDRWAIRFRAEGFVDAEKQQAYDTHYLTGNASGIANDVGA